MSLAVNGSFTASFFDFDGPTGSDAFETQKKGMCNVNLRTFLPIAASALALSFCTATSAHANIISVTYSLSGSGGGDLDYAHNMLCLDDAKLMQPQIKGRHIELLTPSHRESGVLLTEPLIVSIHLSGLPGKTLLQLLDSGTNVPLLYDSAKDMAGGFSVSGPIRDHGPEGAERVFAVLPPQDMQVGTLTVHQISFITPAATKKDIPKLEVDGLLPTAIFRRVYTVMPIVLLSWSRGRQKSPTDRSQSLYAGLNPSLTPPHHFRTCKMGSIVSY